MSNRKIGSGGVWLFALFSLALMGTSAFAASFTQGDIVVSQLAGTGKNTTGTILELAPSGAGQTPALSIPISATGTSALRFSDSGTSSFLSTSNDGTLLIISGYNTTDATDSDLATVTSLDPASDRAVGTLDVNSNFSLVTTYTGISGNQTRSATSLDNIHFFITDKGGLYTNGATAGSLTTNILNARAFGGVAYVSSTAAISGVSIVSSPTASVLGGLPGLPADSKIQDFYFVQSGQNGSIYDVLYTLDQGAPTSTTAQINKYFFNGTSWQAAGTYALKNAGGTAISATGMIAANNGGGGVNLYVVTTAQAAANSVVSYTDAAAFNANISVNGANSVTLFTASGSNTLKGIAFAPIPPTAPVVSNPTKSGVGINSATLGGTITATGGQAVTGFGIVYSLTAVNSNPQIGGAGVTQVQGTPPAPIGTAFTLSASGLQNTSNYSYAAYAINSIGTGYSSVDTFSTLNANPPTIDTPAVSSIADSSATLGGTVESNGGATITKTGVVYALTSANNNPKIGGNGVIELDTNAAIDSGPFTLSATGLSSGSGYTFAAFATNSSGTAYTSATSFTTLSAPIVNTPTVTAVTGSSAILGGKAASDGGSTITKRGVVFALTSTNNNPQLGGNGVTEVDASGTTGTFTVSANGLSGSSSYTFAAFASNSIGTSYSSTVAFTTAAPGIITAWTFPTLAGAGDNSPSPTYGAGTATTLGMTNTYNGGNTASDDVVVTAGSANTKFSENTWRIRGASHNGWATYQNGAGAPEYTQGIELDTSTVGYSNIVFSFDWYSTTQGIRDLQVQYNTGGGWVNYQGPSASGTFIAASNDYYNSQLSPVSPTIYVDLSGVAAANNNPNLGIRLVSAFDSTGTLGNEYASAASSPDAIAPYNNTSGNWRFANLTFAAGVTTTTALAASPIGSQDHGGNVTFTATVTPASGTQYPAGTVVFFDGANQLGTAQTVTEVGTSNVGSASITLNTLAAGTHGDITAQYSPATGSGMIASGSSMNLAVGDPADNPITYTISAPQATGVNVSPVVGQSFTGVVATFSDGLTTDPTGFSATIDWGDGHTSNGVIAFSSSINETNLSGAIVDIILFTVTGTNTYSSTGEYPITVTITDSGNNTTTVNPTARVANSPLIVTGVPPINANGGILANQAVATFTDPGLVANLGALGVNDPTTQFSASINWGDNTAATPGTISYDAASQVFSVSGAHTYAQPGSYPISVTVTPLTVSVMRVDSSDPNFLNQIGDENGDGLTDSPSPVFIDQFVIGAAGQSAPLYTFSLPTVSTTTGNLALTNASYSASEGELNLSTNGQYLVLAGYNGTVSLWAPQTTYSPDTVINRVIGTINGAGVINTTTGLTDAYDGDNFRGIASTDGVNFWTAGHAGTGTDGFVHYATLGASTSTLLTGANSTPYNPDNIATVKIFNGQVYVGVRSVSATAPAGIYQIGTGLPTSSGQSETLFIQVPQTNALDITAGKPTSPVGFFMAYLPGNPNSQNGVNVAYIADFELGIARYDYNGTAWQFSYYINSTGTFLDSTYTVDSTGTVTPTASFDSTLPIPVSDPNRDRSKAGGVKELTGRVVNGVVQLFAVTGFGSDSQPAPHNSLIQVNDTGANAPFTVLATDPGISKFSGVAFTPSQIVTSSATAIGAPSADALAVSVPFNTSTSITLTGSDPNTPPLTPLTYTITVSPAGGTLSGTAPNLTYTPAPGFNGADSFKFTVANTAGLSSDKATVALNVAAGAPTALAQAVDVSFNTATSVTLVGNDPNVPALTLTYTVTVPPANGTLSGTAPNLTYTPNTGFNGADSFQFSVTNTAGLSSPAAAVSLTVAAGVPTANAQAVTVPFNTPTSITLTGSDPNIPALIPLVFTVTVFPTEGTLSGTAPNLTYTPAPGYNGLDSFQFTVTNTAGLVSAAATVSLNVPAGGPSAIAQTVAVPFNKATAITLGGSDPNIPTLTPLTFTVTTAPAKGTLSGTAPNLVYTPNTGVNGADSFQFNVTNSAGLTSAPAAVSLNVAAGAPTADAQSLNVPFNTAKSITLTGSDPNIPALTPLLFNLTVSPSEGILTGTVPNLTYTPNAGYHGADSFQFTVTNTAGVSSGIATVSLTVAAGTPTATAQTLNVAFNTATPVTLGGSDPNVPALTPLAFSVTVNPTHGTLSGTAPNLTYTPNTGYAGVDSFKFTVTNTVGLTSPAATVSLNVAVGSPTANAQAVNVPFNTAKPITLTGSDPNKPALTPLTFAVTANPLHGTLTGTLPNLTYTPHAGFNGADSFQFTVKNTAGFTSAAATVSLTVAAGIPTANAQAVNVPFNTATAITLTGSDPDVPALTLSFTVTVKPLHGMLSGTAPNLTYTPNNGYNGADSFKFTATNTAGNTSPAAILSLSVATGVPTANAQAVNVPFNTGKSITLTGSDPNKPALTPLTFTITANPLHGTLTGTAPALTYTPANGFNGADSLQFTVTNTAGLTSAAATVSLTVAVGVPTATPQTVNVPFNTAMLVTLSGTDPNFPGLTPLTYTVTVKPSHGTLTGNAPNLTYTPTAGYNGADSFKFTVTNSANITSAAAVVSLNVAAGVPTANAQAVNVAFNTAKAITLTGSDPNKPAQTPLTFTVTANPAHGTLTGTLPNLTYTPNNGFNGADSFQFTVKNMAGLTSPAATVSLTVATGVPTATPQTLTVAVNTAKQITLSGTDPNVPALTPLTFTVTVKPTHGTLTGTGSNQTYTPKTGYKGSDSFKFTVTNTAGLISPAATVSITVQ